MRVQAAETRKFCTSACWRARGGSGIVQTAVRPPGAGCEADRAGRTSRGIVETDFHLSTDYHASVDVFDLAGRRLRRVFEGVAQAGSHTVMWDGRNKEGLAGPPGLYFVRAHLPQGSITKRIVVTD